MVELLLEPFRNAAPVRLLVVDDDPTILLTVRRLLRRLAPAATIVQVPSGEAALEALERENWSLVLSDYRMGFVTGTDVLEQARRRQPGSVRVLMSGFGDPRMLAEARERAAIHQFVEKPIQRAEFERELESKLSGYLGGTSS